MSIVVDISNLLLNLALGLALLALYVSARYGEDKTQAWQIQTGASIIAALSFFWARVATVDFYACVPEGERAATVSIDSAIRVALVLLILIPAASHGPHPKTTALSEKLYGADHFDGQDRLDESLGLLSSQARDVWYCIYVSWIVISSFTWFTVVGGRTVYDRGTTYDRWEFALMNFPGYLAMMTTCMTCVEAISYGKRVSVLRYAQALHDEKNNTEAKPDKVEAALVEVQSTSAGPVEVREAGNDLEGIVIDNAQHRGLDEHDMTSPGSLMVQSMWDYPY